MRFITEFQGDDSLWDANSAIIKHRKGIKQDEIGVMIGENIGWQNPVNGNGRHYRLEIEAFPVDKWVEFKMRLSELLKTPPGDEHAKDAAELIKELELFSKE